MIAPGLARIVVFAGAIAACAAAPAQPVRVVVPGPPGGFADIAVRITAERLQQGFGAPVVIEHRPGAGGTVGLEYLKGTRPDGTTIAMINLSPTANESLVKGKSYDLLADFEPIGQYAWLANVLIVNPSIGAASVAALVDALKARPGTPYASGGIGSPAHLASEMLRLRTGLTLTHVPYKGAPPAVTSVVAGETALMFATASAALPQVRGGQVRALAVTVSDRLPQLPDVPTLAESGFADFNVTDWVGILAPKGTPPEARERIHRSFVAAFADREAQERLRNATILPLAQPLGPAEFGVFLRSEVAKWAKVIREAQISTH